MKNYHSSYSTLTTIRTNIKLVLGIFLIKVFLTSCSGDDPIVENSITFLPPGQSVLITPPNNEQCELGNVIGDNAEVFSEWNEASNTKFYQISIENLISGDVVRRNNVVENSIVISLPRGSYYSWFITSINELSETTDSDKWRFYLSNETAGNVAPFPPEAIYPRNNETVILSNSNTILIEWLAEDPDSETLTYTLRIDEIDGLQEPDSELKGLTSNKLEYTVQSGRTYFWSVIASDGNTSSESDVYSFNVK